MKKIMIVLSCCLLSANVLLAQAKVTDNKAGAKVPVPLAEAPRVNGDNTRAVGTVNATVNNVGVQMEAVAAPVVGQPIHAVQNESSTPAVKETPDNKIHLLNDRPHPRKVYKLK